MPKVVIREDESLDNALRRFKREVNNYGGLAKVREKECYIKKPVARKLKQKENARKRARKKI